MKKITSFIIVLFFFGALITLVSLLMPNRVICMRTQMINAQLQDISSQVFDLANWKNWNPAFQQADSVILPAKSRGKGAQVIWVNKKHRNILSIISVTDSLMRFQIDRSGENPIINDIDIHSYEGRADLEVEWRSIHKLKWYPWEKFSGIFVDNTVGPGYEAALKQLKEVTENQ